MVSLHGLTLIKSSVVKGFLFMDVLPARTDASSLTATFKVFLNMCPWLNETSKLSTLRTFSCANTNDLLR